jgi:multidrug efflux system outer membrane protein
MNKYIIRPVGWMGAFITAAWMSCSVPKTAIMQEAQPLPQSFGAVADSSNSIALLSRQEFFPDRHLQQLTDMVLRNNPDMQIALQRVQAAGAYLSSRRGALLPSLSAGVQAGGTRYGDYTMEGVGNFDTNLSPNINEDQKTPTRPTPDLWLGLRTSWEVDIWGRLRQMKKAARLRFLASEQGRNLVTAALVTQTAMMYYELIALDKEAEIIRENISLQERALEVVEAQKAGGRATELAVQQFRAQLLYTRAAAYDVQQRIHAAENALNALAGRYGGTIERGTQLLPEALPPVAQAGIPAQLLERRPDIQQAALELAASRADLTAARAAFFPTLTINAQSAYNAFKPELWFLPGSLMYQLFGGLTAPVFQQNQLRSQFRIATAAQEEAFQQYRKTALNAYREVITTLQAIENARKVYELKQQEVEALQSGVNAANDLYVTGYASYLEIISAQRSRLEAQLQLVNTQRTITGNWIDLYRALGGGWADIKP